MELSLREMGVGDLGVPKHMKRMMQGFNGRANHYEAAILTNDREELKQALIQNVYGTVNRVENKNIESLLDYIFANIALETVEEGFISPDMKGAGKKHA
jgi:cytochrome b pre-mRNA-processing protein 3